MVSPLAGPLADAIHKGFKDIFFTATLLRDEPTTTSPDIDSQYDPPAPVVTEYACKAIRDEYHRFEINGTIILQGDCKILILANSISVRPEKQDRVLLNSQTFYLVDILVDPADALYTCQARQ